jgi:iron complex outermembrane receptor protein
VELDATILLGSNWQTYVSYSYMDAKIVEFSGNDNAILAQDPNQLSPADQAVYKYVYLFHNAPLQMSAPHLANLWTRYDFSQNSMFKNFFVGGGFNLVIDQTLLPDTPKDYHQTYVVGNALIGYQWKLNKQPFTAEFMGKNLGNAYYRPSQSTRSRPLELLFGLSTRF